MPAFNLCDMTWEEVAALDPALVVALLPVGATEAHGPHLPLATDVIIAEAMAQAGALRLEARGKLPLLLPAVAYSVTRFAAGFAGTLSIRPETATALVVDVARALVGRGVGRLVLANAHLEPAHLASLDAAAAAIRAEPILAVAFPDVTKKPWALRMTDEFKSGACHAGRYETSIVLAARPDLVRDARRAALPPNPTSLARAIRDGKGTFEEAGGPHAYFGDPAAATAAEGERTLAVLGGIVEEAALGLFGE